MYLDSDDQRWKATMLFAAFLTEDAGTIDLALKGVKDQQAVANALRGAAEAFEPAKPGAKCSPSLRRLTLALVRSVADQDEAATDGVLAAFNPDEADGDEVLEVLGLATHVLSIRMGYESGCTDDDTPDDPPVAFPTDFM
jgi:hypothetical protein